MRAEKLRRDLGRKVKVRTHEKEKVRRRGDIGVYIANTMDLDGRVRDLQIPRRKQHSEAEKDRALHEGR